jgi:hypothetical protein
MAIAIDVARAFDEGRHVLERADLAFTVLGLTPLIFGKIDAALFRVAGLAEIGRQGFQILEGDVGGNIDRIRAQEIAQEGYAHRFALEIVDDMLAHVTGADPVIDRIVKPGAVLQEIGKRRLADAGHAEDGYGLIGPVPELPAGLETHRSSSNDCGLNSLWDGQRATAAM